jgi:hypothetical protein
LSDPGRLPAFVDEFNKAIVLLSDPGPAWAAVAPTRYSTQIAVCTLHCESIIARGSCAARVALSRRSRGCTRRRGRTGSTGRSTGRSCRSSLGPAEYICWSERSGARTSRVRQAEPGSRVTVAVAAVGKVPVAAYCEPQPWSAQWEQPEFAWWRRLSYARYAQPSTEQRGV